MNVLTNTFLGGMDRDSDIHFVKDSSYRYAENVRIITENNGTLGVLLNIKASKNIELTGDEFIGDIICIHNIDKYIILITVEDSINRIYRCVEEENGLNLTCILTSDMGLTTDSRLSLVNCVESLDNIKLYIACKEHYLRIIDVLKDYGLVDSSYLDIIPSCELPLLQFDSIGSGNLKSGSAQYFYQLFNTRYNNTVFSTISPLIHIYNNISKLNQTIGIAKDKYTNASVNLKLSLNKEITDNFNNIRIFKIFYENSVDVPKVSIILEKSLETFTTDYDEISYLYRFVDSIESIVSQITVEELNVVNQIFKAATVDTKNNILFAANIQLSEFDIQYDARAYRLNKNKVLKLYNNGAAESSDSIPGTIVGDNPMKLVDILCKRLLLTYDCVCPYNITTDANDEDYLYQYDNEGELGGYGINVKYKIITKLIILDSLMNHETVYSNSTLYLTAANASPAIKPLSDIFLENIEVEDYSKPINNIKYVGYTRSEIYRFGIVFFNDKNQASPVHWIGDIKMPDYKTSVPFTLDKVEGADENNLYKLYGNILGIKFEIYNIPKEVKYYKIVRCERTSKDRTIITQGILSRTLNSNHTYNFLTGVTSLTTNQSYPVVPLTFCQTRNYYDILSNNYTIGSKVEKICALITPEIDFGDESVLDSIKNKKVQILGMLTNIVNGKRDNDTRHFQYNSGVYWRKIISNKFDTNYKAYAYNLDVSIYELDLSGSNTGNPFVSNFLSKKYTFLYKNEELYNKQLHIDSVILPKVLNLNQIEDLTPYYELIDGRSYINIGKANSGSNSDNDTARSKLGYFGKHAAITFTEDILSLYFPVNFSFENSICNATYIPKFNSSTVYLVNVINDIYPYGGNTYYARNNSIYISISSDIYSSDVNMCEVFGGDTYLSIFDHKTCNVIPNLNNTGRNLNKTYISCVDYIPVESTINHTITHGENTSNNLIEEKLGVVFTYNTNPFLGTEIANGNVTGMYSLSKPYCVYNDAYSVEPFAKKYVSKDMYSITNNYNYNRVYASDVKTNNEVNNSWLNFRQANYIDVEQLGQITNLKSYKDRLLFFQNSAVGVLSVNDRSLITDNNISSLVLGTGDVLSRYDYITKYNGSSIVNDSSIVDSFYGLYWYDYDNKSVVALTDTIANLSTMKLVLSDFSNTTKKVKSSVKDDEFKEILMSFDDKVLVYNETTLNFSSYYTFNYDYCTKLNSNIYYVKDNIITKQSNESDCISKILLIVNLNPLITKVYDNLFFGGYFTDINNMLTEVTFDTKNQSGSIMKDINGKQMIDYREDTYRYAIGRNEFSDSMSFAPRLRGKYLICDYTIDCTNNHNFTLPSINTIYRQSLV